MDDRSGVVYRGIGFSEIITIALVVLKAVDKIDMSWFWVLTSIVWIPVLVAVTIIVFVFIIGFVIVLIDKLRY